MNKKLKILTILSIMHISTYSMIIQPELSRQSKAKLTLYDKARSTYNNALIKYNRLAPARKEKITFDFYKFDFIHDKVAQKYYDATDNLFELALELTESDPNNFIMSPGGVLHRKVFTHPSLGTYEWAPYENYDEAIENLDEFQKKLEATRLSNRALWDNDPVSKEAIGLIEGLLQSAEEMRQTILRAYLL